MTRTSLQPNDLSWADRLSATRGALLLAVQFLLLLHSAPSRAQTFTVLHHFNGGRDGANPAANLILDGKGNLYGTTRGGGLFDYGTVFEIDTSGKETTLHSFWSGDGEWPEGGLILDTAGNLLGAASEGGTQRAGGCSHGCGTIFRVDSAGKFTVLHNFFTGATGGDPTGSLVADQTGSLYGTAMIDGNPHSTCGVVFKLDPTGKESVLYVFKGPPDGCYPDGGLIQDMAGNFYGVTTGGGVYKLGTVFKVDAAGNETVLYSLESYDGDLPKGPLARDAMGNLYGVALLGGVNGNGVVFKLDNAGNETTLYGFKGPPDGSYPVGGVVLDSVGNLYGVTEWGGSGSKCGSIGCGTVYKIDANGNESVLHNFTGEDGIFPSAGLVVDGSGNLYGTTYDGGDVACPGDTGECGVVFKLTP
jgi:uncharacterized repeat protein (TIGR03803 family)